jgi:hypothetical protein
MRIDRGLFINIISISNRSLTVKPHVIHLLKRKSVVEKANSKKTVTLG